MGRHLSPATVLAALALFVSLTGTAAASIIISANHQVAAHTIAGASAPVGDNKNLIAGSVGTSDLHNGAVTSNAVKDGSLTGADLRNATLGINKLVLPQIAFSGPGADPDDLAPHHVAVSLDGVTLGVSCIFTSTPTATTRLALFLKSTAGGTLQGAYAEGAGPVGSATEENLKAGVGSDPFGFATVSSDNATQPELLDGQFTYYDANRVIVFTLSASATRGASCNLRGTAMPAPN